jgi:hypothetical protein
MPAALRLQQTFSSWQDLQSDFLVGREYWSIGQTQKTGERFRTIYERFLQDPASPRNVNPRGWTCKCRLQSDLSRLGLGYALLCIEYFTFGGKA